MEEIIIRAWNKETKKMIDGSPLQYWLNKENSNGNAEGQVGMKQPNVDDAFKNYEHLEFMLYTGLKDKNGEEIFKGDIVKYQDPDLEDDYSGIYEVIWDDLCAGFVLCDGETIWDYSPFSDEDSMEVIGNIYENPELLKTNTN